MTHRAPALPGMAEHTSPDRHRTGAECAACGATSCRCEARGIEAVSLFADADPAGVIEHQALEPELEPEPEPYYLAPTSPVPATAAAESPVPVLTHPTTTGGTMTTATQDRLATAHDLARRLGAQLGELIRTAHDLDADQAARLVSAWSAAQEALLAVSAVA